MKSSKKLDVITIEDKFSLSPNEIFERANEIARVRGFENGWEVSEVRTSKSVSTENTLRIYQFDVFGFDSSGTLSNESESKPINDGPSKAAAASSPVEL